MPQITGDEPEEVPLYAERPEWQDVTPISQYEGMNPIAPIFYTPEYKDATDYFRGVVKTGEKSERVLELTLAIIKKNPAHYSAWQYRYHTLLELKSPLDVELKLMDVLAIEYLKTYQVWHHRRLIITALYSSPSSRSTPAGLAEQTFITKALEEDTKNYHTWSYRQWLLAFFDDGKMWEGELAFVEKLLEEDVRNNSAWHHRYFVVFGKGQGKSRSDREDLLKSEVSYTKEQIAVAPNNPSAWNYLRGVLEATNTPFTSLQTFVKPYTSLQPPPDNQDVVDLENPLPGPTAELPCVAAMEFLADIYEKEGGDSVQKAVPLWKSLAHEHDTMRKKYWEYRIKSALEK